MSRAVDCSICIANFNGMDVIDNCLRSILSQIGNVRHEILIHDDASSDGSDVHIERNYPQVRLIRSTANVGFCVANNRMAAQATGHYLLFLNNDAMLMPDSLSTLKSIANDTDILSLPQFDAEKSSLIDCGYFLDPFLNPVPLRQSRDEVAMVIGACLWIPRARWQMIGGFPEWFHTLAEDMYLCCAARLSGSNVRVAPTSGYRHRVGHSLGGGKARENSLNTTVRRRRLSERNKGYVMLLCFPAPLLLFVLPAHAALLTLEGLALSLWHRKNRLGEIYWPALAALWINRRNIRETRLRVQALRVVGWRVFFSVFTLFPHKLWMLIRYGIPTIERQD